MGMLDTLPGMPEIFIWDEQRADAMDFSLACAMFYPETPALLFLVKWCLWASYVDDYVQRLYLSTANILGIKAFNERLSLFMPLDGSPMPIPLNPVERGLADLWSTSITLVSGDELSKIRRGFLGQCESHLWETVNRSQNRLADPVDYMEMRAKSVTTETLVLPMKMAIAEQLLPDVFASPTIAKLLKAVKDYSVLCNDLFSYQKEIEFEGDMCNSILIAQHLLKCTLAQAVDVVNNIMTACLQQFEYIVETELPILCEKFALDNKAQQALWKYVEGLQRFLCGYLQWHQITGRFSETEAKRGFTSWHLVHNLTELVNSSNGNDSSLGSGSSQARILPNFLPGRLTGLGVSAAQILTHFRTNANVPAVRSPQSPLDPHTGLRPLPAEAGVYANPETDSEGTQSISSNEADSIRQSNHLFGLPTGLGSSAVQISALLQSMEAKKSPR